METSLLFVICSHSLIDLQTIFSTFTDFSKNFHAHWDMSYTIKRRMIMLQDVSTYANITTLLCPCTNTNEACHINRIHSHILTADQNFTTFVIVCLHVSSEWCPVTEHPPIPWGTSLPSVRDSVLLTPYSILFFFVWWFFCFLFILNFAENSCFQHDIDTKLTRTCVIFSSCLLNDCRALLFASWSDFMAKWCLHPLPNFNSSAQLSFLSSVLCPFK